MKIEISIICEAFEKLACRKHKNLLVINKAKEGTMKDVLCSRKHKEGGRGGEVFYLR